MPTPHLVGPLHGRPQQVVLSLRLVLPSGRAHTARRPRTNCTPPAAYLRDKTASRPAHLVLDLSGVTFLASTGVGLLIAARDGQGGIHGELHLTGVAADRAVHHVLQVVGVLARFAIRDDEDDLLRRLAH
jgi:anti-anti-sigma factor